METKIERNANVQQGNKVARYIKNTFNNLVKLVKLIPFSMRILLLFFAFPFLLNLIITYLGTPWKYVGNGEDWLGFFSNYSGGFIGAIVALIVATSQGKQQKEILNEEIEAIKEENKLQFERVRQAEKEKEEYQRKIAQIQPLIIAKYEVREIISSLQKVNFLRLKGVEHIQKRDKILNPTYEESLTMKQEVERKEYNLRPVNENLLSCIHLIEDIDLQSKLYSKLSTYMDFIVALSENITSEEWNYNPEKGIPLQFAMFEAHELDKKKSLIIAEKERFWHYIDTGLIKQLASLLDRIEDELKASKSLRSQSIEVNKSQ